ncbi:MAG: hypothetical protein P9M13_03620 [Candidatus Ancaeobacter aquaticus]|nr:hypothetical protein [Candidatus Ancaeobacter aquaticus]
MDLFKVNVKGVKTLKVMRNQTILDILPLIPTREKLPPLAAVVNNRLVGLDYHIGSDCEIEIVTLSHPAGKAVYRRTVINILMQALKNVLPEARTTIGMSISNGYYFDFNGKEPLTSKLLKEIHEAMCTIVKDDMRYIKKTVSLEEALGYFKKEKMTDKVKFLSHTHVTELSVVSCGNFMDMYFGQMAFSTGTVDAFKLYLKKPGFVLSFPSTKCPKKVSRFVNRPKFFNVYRETRNWYEILGVENVGDLNELSISGGISEIVKIAEGLHEKKIAQIADAITKKQKTVKIILISGPTASGKTTFAKKLAIQLRVNGLKPKSINLDNYFIDRCKIKKEKNGIANYESIDTIDVPLLNKHLKLLLSGKKADTPTFSFHTGKRLIDKYNTFSLQPYGVLIVEGIHGLNNKLTHLIPAKSKYKIFVSALTQLCIDNNNRILTSDSRLLRRIVRDKLFRSYSAANTLERWPSVRESEERNIFRFQEGVDICFNSVLIYEHAVLKDYAARYLLEVTPDQKEYVEASRLLEFLDIFVPISTREVPNTSILREFIGGSTFNYR